MFFKNYFLGVADILQAKFLGHERENQHSGDKGELSENFVQEFLTDSLADNFKIFRGGQIINSSGKSSKQLDIVLCGKRTIKIFGDKGIYPIESVAGVFSITANLSFSKLKDCMKEFHSIPKYGYHFSIEKFYGETFVKQTMNTYKLLFPFTCVFAFKGDINERWVEEILGFLTKNKIDPALWPDLIVVNKKGMIELSRTKTESGTIDLRYQFVDFTDYTNYGICFTKILFHLYNLSHEEFILKPQYEQYFNKDLEEKNDDL
ncbi:MULTISPECIES: DUF6602 domain-containing protein [unclassified Imperialibacter]|uniref:DUF6602 domain-containing protein n=1 Tax=unclassified Imperialibacter TaxID=2629706 RepID=UPI00125C20B2|nr:MULTISPECIES: DUF6602 domain-containing protein [unclassified Imperialibacter]CAD5256218.1 conserved hypothetical protein [Imperialibacter sp. 89]CAD5262330.1 conserved hypothetical protein [Imperialibacter sp. 75]VVT33170.1 conserved hypothetical protein [Imperialibacter sp. EC-SDR9]